MGVKNVLISSVFFVLLVQPALASKVYFCTMTKNIELTENNVKNYKTGRFTMSVGENEVILSGKPIGKLHLRLVNRVVKQAGTDGFFTAERKDEMGNPEMIAGMTGKDLFVSIVLEDAVMAFHAVCEDF